ncbi:SGNH/GDSL hydrolase family protein [bacterium]|nr:SGNH/GDSL hydrolase family protein [bacterium]
MFKFFLVFTAVFAASTVPGTADTTKRAGPGPDILVLGDSQISFGAGQVYNEFFSEIENRCAPYDTTDIGIPTLRNATVASVGVRSTGLHSWVASDEQSKATICEVDEKYGVNAGVYGIAGNADRTFVQIGKGPHYQFCAPNRSPFQEMFADGYYTPDLLVLSFLGNASQRWADDPELARKDVAMTLSQIPQEMPCIFMTTVPVFGDKANVERRKAQANIKAAFKPHERCSFVEAYTPELVAEIEGNPQYFSRRDNGTVKDPFHPVPSAVRRFVTFNTPQICRAVFDEFGKSN